MQTWDHIIQSAMLGTDKKQALPAEQYGALAEIMEQVATNPLTDKEEKFLQSASLVFNYRQCGAMPLQQEHIHLPVAEKEDYPYCNTAAVQVLSDITREDSNGLLTIWLQYCSASRQLVIPSLLPLLFTKAEKNIALRAMTEQCCGRRGAWLAQFNDNWNFSSVAPSEELWQTGTPEQRKQALQQLRITDPVTARAWLIQTWPQENVNSKVAFLKVLSETADKDDIEWLELVATEKNQKVKEEALNILKRLPGSSVVQKYWAILREAVVLKKEKALFGLTSKTVLQLQLPATIDDTIFKTGIEKLSSQKEITDEEFVILQLMRSVPPAAWETHFNASPETIIGYFQQQESNKKYLAAMVIAIVGFKDMRWAFAFMQHSKVFYIDIIPLLPLQQQEFYSNKFFQGFEASIINHAIERKEEWGAELTRNIFKYTANNPYQYNRSFYNKNIHLIPVQIVGELEKCTPAEVYDRGVWSNTSEYIFQLVTLKIQIIKAFAKSN